MRREDQAEPARPRRAVLGGVRECALGLPLALALLIARPPVVRADDTLPPPDPESRDASRAEGPHATESSVSEASDARFDGPDDPAARQRDLVAMTAAASRWPASYGILWRAARASWAVGDRLDEDRDAVRLVELGRQARAWAEAAVRIQPEGIEGRFYRALAVSVYARGSGLIRSLFEGLGGRYESDMEFVIAKDPAWGFGAGYRALGRYWSVVPRPKRNLARSEEQLRQSLRFAPEWMRTHLYLGDTLRALGRPDEAAKEYRFVLDHPAPPTEANEVESVRSDARRALDALSRN